MYPSQNEMQSSTCQLVEDASAYWGMNARELDRAIRKDLGDRNIKVADIGVAGENLVRFASVRGKDAGRAADRCATGTITDFRNPEAVVVGGHGNPLLTCSSRPAQLSQSSGDRCYGRTRQGPYEKNMSDGDDIDEELQ
jgi:aldehyde:ferredoxin oxidoreductase